jgi:hypothetical protein
MHDSNIRSQNEQYDQDYLDRYNLVIGMAGKLIKRHVAEIKKNLVNLDLHYNKFNES